MIKKLFDFPNDPVIIKNIDISYFIFHPLRKIYANFNMPIGKYIIHRFGNHHTLFDNNASICRFDNVSIISERIIKSKMQV